MFYNFSQLDAIMDAAASYDDAMQAYFDASNSPVAQAYFDISNSATFQNYCDIQDKIYNFLNISNPYEYIDDLNYNIEQISSLSHQNFKKIKRMVVKNAPELHNIANNISSSVEQSNVDDTIVLSEPFAQLISSIDNSITFTDADNNDNKIHIKKKNRNYYTIIATICTILGFIFNIYQEHANTVLTKQNHAEIMQELHKQTSLLEQITNSLNEYISSNQKTNQ